MATVKHRKLFKFHMLFFFFLFGCATGTPPILQEDAVTFSYGAGTEKFTEAAHIDGIFKAIARIEANSGGRRYPPLRVALMLKLPSLMRIETIPAIGPPDFFLALTYDTLKAFLPAKQEFYQGRASRENLALFFPVSMPPEDMVHILMGTPPGITGKNLTFREGAADGKRWLDVSSPDGKKIMALRMDGVANRLAEMDIFAPNGEILYTASYNEYSRVGDNIDLPQRITILLSETNLTVAVRYSDMELSRETDETLFDLALPPGLTPIILDPGDTGASMKENK